MQLLKLINDAKGAFPHAPRRARLECVELAEIVPNAVAVDRRARCSGATERRGPLPTARILRSAVLSPVRISAAPHAMVVADWQRAVGSCNSPRPSTKLPS